MNIHYQYPVISRDQQIIGETQACIICGEEAIYHLGHVHIDNSDHGKKQYLLAGWCKNHKVPTLPYPSKCNGCCGYFGHFNTAGI